jgi:hypothetical protein
VVELLEVDMVRGLLRVSRRRERKRKKWREEKEEGDLRLSKLKEKGGLEGSEIGVSES